MISAFIIAHNESDRIKNAILSLKEIADEILVIDSGSTDDTVQVAEKLGCRVIYRPWEGYVQQKTFGEAQCAHDWILNLDADEVLPQALIDEIKTLFARGEPSAQAYKIVQVHRHHLDQGLWKEAQKMVPVRLYHRKFASFSGVKNSSYHDRVALNPGCQVKTLENYMYHDSVRSYRHMIAKMNDASDIQAADMFKNNRPLSLLRLILEVPRTWIKYYFFRRYFLYGMAGFIDATMLSFWHFVRLVKLYELYSKK